MRDSMTQNIQIKPKIFRIPFTTQQIRGKSTTQQIRIKM